MAEKPVPQVGRGPGRPRSAAKGEAILAAAREVFLSVGYSEASMDAVAEQAGVSKATVYSHFGSKQDLFFAVVHERRQEILASFRVAFEGQGRGEDPRQDLEAFAVTFQQQIILGEACCWNRLVVAEAGRHPELAQGMFASGAAVVLQMLGKYMHRQTAVGRLNTDHPERAAEHFLGMVIGLELIRSQMASLPQRSEAEWRERAHSVVAAFLRAYGIQAKG